ncbi:hypothetical protein HPC49_20085 [Pyxidicoccus fallax]|uniref:Porin domain-containing protein n=1 Tax=Pyxidicoccus fallax TaxID=394095 RepID=A0A848LM98_9BACT|nr:hypothetical protein [Pyxidicoccus fallax]NMO18866.1 hypothetical protein [Pyxidicoccus fallax]NPC80511.1 hypothetical protein [Pyxidicoccus fallax]
MSHIRSLVLSAALLLGGAASGMPLEEGKFFINGYGRLTTGRSWGGGNVYLGADEDFGLHDVGSTLMFRALPTEGLTLNTQFSFEKSPGSTRFAPGVDYAFAEWAFSDKLRVRVGRNQLPLALYSEVYDVGTLRPFNYLPQGTYGGTSIGVENYDGAGVTGRIGLPADWMLEYDAYAGFLDLKDAASEGCSATSLCLRSTHALGARVALWTPVEGLRVTASGYASRDPQEVQGENLTRGVAGLGAEYLGEKLWVRAEFFSLFSEQADTRTGYLEAAYFLTSHWQVAGRVEGSRSWFPEPMPDNLLTLFRHREFAAGVNYWFNPNLVIKLSFHNVIGNRFALPKPSPEGGFVFPTEPHTRTVSLGTQFSF